MTYTVHGFLHIIKLFEYKQLLKGTIKLYDKLELKATKDRLESWNIKGYLATWTIIDNNLEGYQHFHAFTS